MATIKIVDVAQEIFDEMGSPDDISIPSISFWLRTNYGKINNLITTAFSLNDTTLELSPDLDAQTADIFKLLYHVYYADRKIRENLGASSVSSFLELTSDGGSIRRVSPSEKAKTYLQLRKELQSQLDDAVVSFSAGQIQPLAIHGADCLDNETSERFKNRSNC